MARQTWDSKCLKLVTKKFTCDFTIYFGKFQKIRIISVSGHCLGEKVCRQTVVGIKCDQSISRIFESNFWRVFVIWPMSNLGLQ